MVTANRRKLPEGRSEGLREKIRQYVSELDPKHLSIDRTEPVEVLEVTHGAYNLNYRIRAGSKDFIFRINIEQQSGIRDQVRYEYDALRFLADHQIAPKAFHVDTTRSRFDHGILIEEFLEGSRLHLEAKEMPAVAALLARLHSLKGAERKFIVWNEPLVDTFELVRRDHIEYEARPSADKRLLDLGKDLLARWAPLVHKHRHLYAPDALNHTDVAPDNIIVTPAGLWLIDWEKPRLDDCSYDLCCFLSEPAQMWGSEKVLCQEGRETFLAAYIALSGKDDELERLKVAYRYPLVSLHWSLWGALQLADLNEKRTTPELQEAHEMKAGRYLKIADPATVERLLDTSVPLI